MGGSTGTNRGIRAFVAVLVALADRKICTLFGGAVWPIIGRRCIAVGHGPADVPPPTARSSRGFFRSNLIATELLKRLDHPSPGKVFCELLCK